MPDQGFQQLVAKSHQLCKELPQRQKYLAV